MNKQMLSLLFCSFLLILTGCDTGSISSPSGAETPGYQTISPQDAKTLLDQNAEIILVDVRRTDEYEEAHIPGAIHIANEDITDAPPAQLPDPAAEIILYCRSGRRSKEAADKLVQLGYTNVWDLGGIIDWPYDTVSGVQPGTWVSGSEEESTTSGGLLSSFSATDLEGNPLDQSMLEGYSLTMVNAWATFCSPCLREMPDLGELAAEYEAKGVQIVGMVTDVLNSDGSISDSQIETAREIVEATKAHYPHIIPSENLFWLLNQITSVPTTFFVDQDGNQVGTAYLGAKSKADWAVIIDTVLTEVSP